MGEKSRAETRLRRVGSPKDSWCERDGRTSNRGKVSFYSCSWPVAEWLRLDERSLYIGWHLYTHLLNATVHASPSSPLPLYPVTPTRTHVTFSVCSFVLFSIIVPLRGKCRFGNDDTYVRVPYIFLSRRFVVGRSACDRKKKLRERTTKRTRWKNRTKNRAEEWFNSKNNRGEVTRSR